MSLSQFINENLEPILVEWEDFARTLFPGAEAMSKATLRDHAQQMLESIALDMECRQSKAQQEEKSKGHGPGTAAGGAASAASAHGKLRQASGFTLLQLTAEFRALRASVLKLWLGDTRALSAEATGDLMRFNEAIDQALAESVVKFAEHAGRTRDTFLAMLGHDLRGPLASMTVAGDFLVRPEARKADISAVGDRVKRGAATMAAMVNDLLEYARTQLGGRMPLQASVSNLRAVGVVSLRDAGALHPDCPFELVAEGDLEGDFDAARMQQVITNLLGNAAQHRDRQYRVTLSLSGEPDRLTMHVKNRGPVIPASEYEAIFDPLVQLAQQGESSARPATNMGLGLFIAREIVEAHHGTIAVASTEKEGTIFTVTLPRKRPRFA